MTHIPSPIFHDSHPTAHIPRSIIRFQLFCHRKILEQRGQHAYPCPFPMIPELPAISLLSSSVVPIYVRYSISGPQFHLQSAIPSPVRSSISNPLLRLRSAVLSPIRYAISGPQFHLQSVTPSPVRSSISNPLFRLRSATPSPFPISCICPGLRIMCSHAPQYVKTT